MRVVQCIKASCLTAYTNGSTCEELSDVKENQKSQNRNVLCCIVEVKQYYCLSYRRWKGVISRFVPVLIFLQDSHSILFRWNKGPYSVCLSLHCHSPPQQPPKLQYHPPLQRLSPSKGLTLIIMGYFLSRWSIVPSTTSVPMHVLQYPGPPETTCAAKRVKTYP